MVDLLPAMVDLNLLIYIVYGNIVLHKTYPNLYDQLQSTQPGSKSIPIKNSLSSILLSRNYVVFLF